LWDDTDSRRTVVADFDGGTITTEAGGLLLHRTEQKTGILRQFAGCFRDYRDPARIEHSVAELMRQRVYGLALGYEDLNDQMQKAEAEAREAMLKDLEKVVEEIGKKNGFTMIFERRSSGIMFLEAAIDITDKVIEAYNKMKGQ